MRIVVAMSGGVDSSAAAGLLKEQGHEVIGLAMKTHDLEPRRNRACCTPDDMRDARRVADLLDIPFYVLNYADLFRELVIKPFAEAYRRGHTPNPCIVCNDKVKFEPMLERARLLGADALATGHYARLETAEDGSVRLLRAVDANKDQSYFLYRLRPEQLARLQFPLGGMVKDEVRAHADRLGLPVAAKQESQEICFVGAEGYAATVEKLGGGGRVGPILGQDGAVLGKHEGVHRYTLGQRRGLGIAHPEPLYVTDIDAKGGAVHVGPKSALLRDAVRVGNLSWVAGHPPAEGRAVGVQQRYRDTPKAAVVTSVTEDDVVLTFDESQPRGAPGQAAVLFDGDEVLGGGMILPPHEETTAEVSEVSAHG